MEEAHHTPPAILKRVICGSSAHVPSGRSLGPGERPPHSVYSPGRAGGKSRRSRRGHDLNYFCSEL